MRPSKRCIAVFSAITSVFFALASHADAKPKVVVSIAPVHSLVASIMRDVGTPELLVSANASPHAYSLRPSEARLLADADIIFRVGPDMEVFLVKPLEALTIATVVTYADAPGITGQLASTETAFEAHSDSEHYEEHPKEEPHQDEAHKEGEHHEDDHGHHAHVTDPHIWLSIGNARRIADITAATLKQHDPENATIYTRNLARLNVRLGQLETELRDIVVPVKQQQFVVMHDAYRHFEAEFGLQSAGAITLSPERSPGARRLKEVRDLLFDANIRCVFSEPQFPTAIAATVVEGTKVRLSQLDPVGVNIPPGPEHYFTLMGNLGRDLSDCLRD